MNRNRKDEHIETIGDNPSSGGGGFISQQGHDLHGHHHRDGDTAMTPFTVSPEEYRVLKQCQRESFYQRSLPLAITGFAGVGLAARFGYTKPRIWKYALAGFLGYTLGKWSYIKVCKDKILATLPNSALAQRIREKQGMYSREVWETVAPEVPSIPIFRQEEAMPGQIQYNPESSVGAGQNLHSDTEGHENIPQRPIVTYDELRNANRQEYANKTQPFVAGRSGGARTQTNSDYTKNVGTLPEQYPSPPAKIGSDKIPPGTINVPPQQQTRPYSSTGKKTTQYGDTDFS